MPHLLRKRQKSEAGFTLIELLIVIVLMGIIGTIFTTTVLNATKVDERTRLRADAQQALTLATSRITEELRVAAPLVSLSDSTVVVDVYPEQPSGATLRERHTFSKTGGILTQRVENFSPATSTIPTTSSTRRLAEGLAAGLVAFTGHDREGNVTTNAAKVASVDIAFSLPTGSSKPFEAATTVFLRNYQG